MKTELKVGDWVVLKSYSPKSRMDQRGLIYQVLALPPVTTSVKAIPFSRKDGGYTLLLKHEIRLATPEEVAAVVTQAIRQEEPNEFDRIGEMYAVNRAPGEDDSHFRKRLLVAVSDPKAAEMSGIGYDVVRDLLLG